jgi:disulfide bond formation protein DsbB
MTPTSFAASREPAYRWGAATLFAATAVIAAALGFEHLGGYKPCPLCLQQRYAYYVGIPVLFVALALTSAERGRAAGVLFFAVALAFLANAGLGVYHAGAEWRLWTGPETCASALEPLAVGKGGLLTELESTRVVRCDQAPWRFAALSFAGWNVVFSLALTLGAFKAAIATCPARPLLRFPS